METRVRPPPFLLFLALAISFSFATGVSSVTSAANQLCADLQSMLPIVAMIMIVLAAIIYGAGQAMGAETRARAITWATAALAGAIIAGLIYAVAPLVMSAIYGSANFTCQGASGVAAGGAQGAACPAQCAVCSRCEGNACVPITCTGNRHCNPVTGGCECNENAQECGDACCAGSKLCINGRCGCPDGPECGSQCCGAGLVCTPAQQCVVPGGLNAACGDAQPCKAGLECCSHGPTPHCYNPDTHTCYASGLTCGHLQYPCGGAGCLPNSPEIVLLACCVPDITILDPPIDKIQLDEKGEICASQFQCALHEGTHTDCGLPNNCAPACTGTQTCCGGSWGSGGICCANGCDAANQDQCQA